MKTKIQTLTTSVLLAGGLYFSAATVTGAPVTFTVDPNESTLTITSAVLSGSLPIVGAFSVPLEQQEQGSLETSYSGAVEVDISPTQISFPGGSLIVAANKGSYQPGVGGVPGSAAANYGGVGSTSLPFVGSVTVNAAMRGIGFDVTAPTAIAINGSSFSANSLVFGFSTNADSTLDWRATGAIDDGGPYTLTGLSTNNVGTDATLTDNGTEMVLTVPIQYTGTGWIISEDDFTYTLMGTLVARAGPVTPPLEIMSSIVDGQLVFNINTEIGQHYSVVGADTPADLPDGPSASVVDEFTATQNPTIRLIGQPNLPEHFFLVRQD